MQGRISPERGCRPRQRAAAAPAAERPQRGAGTGQHSRRGLPPSTGLAGGLGGSGGRVEGRASGGYPPPDTQKRPYSPPHWVIYGLQCGNRTAVLLYGRARGLTLSAGFTNGNREEHTFV